MITSPYIIYDTDIKKNKINNNISNDLFRLFFILIVSRIFKFYFFDNKNCMFNIKELFNTEFLYSLIGILIASLIYHFYIE